MRNSHSVTCSMQYSSVICMDVWVELRRRTGVLEHQKYPGLSVLSPTQYRRCTFEITIIYDDILFLRKTYAIYLFFTVSMAISMVTLILLQFSSKTRGEPQDDKYSNHNSPTLLNIFAQSAEPVEWTSSSCFTSRHMSIRLFHFGCWKIELFYVVGIIKL